MLTRERINSLLEVNANKEENQKVLRIMSCENPVKDLYLYNLKNIKSELGENTNEIDKQVSLCIYKFYIELKSYLVGKSNTLEMKNSNITLNIQLIDNAIEEVYTLYYLVDKILNKKEFDTAIFNEMLDLQMENFISILQLCGLINISNNIYNSKILSILLRVKEKINDYKYGKIRKNTLINELTLHVNYLSTQLDILKYNNLFKEDFIIYILLFDIRKYRRFN